MSAVVTRQLLRDIEQVKLKHPGLNEIKSGNKIFGLQGTIVIRDEQDFFQGEFEIKILVNANYPRHFPVMYELSHKIERIDDRHIDNKGLTCVEVEPVQLLIARRGISIADFIDLYAYKYFCAQIYFDSQEHWPGSEWRHEEEGIRDYFYALFQTSSDSFVHSILQMAVSHAIPGRNDLCFCGSARKYKHCHKSQMEELGQIPVSKLADYERFFLTPYPPQNL